jgi:hypothetical protein
VLVGRRAALTEPFQALTAALHEALGEVGGKAGETSRSEA